MDQRSDTMIRGPVDRLARTLQVAEGMNAFESTRTDGQFETK